MKLHKATIFGPKCRKWANLRMCPKSGTHDSHGIEIWQSCGCFSAAESLARGSADWSYPSPPEAG